VGTSPLEAELSSVQVIASYECAHYNLRFQNYSSIKKEHLKLSNMYSEKALEQTVRVVEAKREREPNLKLCTLLDLRLAQRCL
jgi:hypothetical protein